MQPKGSIVVECGNALLKNGYKLKILNTINFKKSMHYNPFAYVHSEKDILKLVTAHPEIPAVGNYITLTGKADRIDPVFRTLQVGETVVPFEDLVEISGESIMEIDQYLGITED